MSGADNQNPSVGLEREIELTERVLALTLDGVRSRQKAGRDTRLLCQWATELRERPRGAARCPGPGDGRSAVDVQEQGPVIEPLV
jgi:hypothetical protein